MQTAKCYATKAISPAVSIVRKIKTKAVNSNAGKPKDILDTQAAHKAAGTDMALTSSKRFFREQVNLVPYRVERLYLEVEYIANGSYFKDYTYKRFIFDLRTLTHVLCVYLFTKMAGRHSVFPLIEPGSPLEDGIRLRTNPNY